MTTPPPPPSWPTSSGQGTERQVARQQSWWTGGRVLAAIALVVVLMTGSAVAGFLAGASWDGFTDLATTFDGDPEGGLGAPPTGPTADGDLLRVGTTVDGTLPEDGSVEHVFTVEQRTDVTIKLSSDDFDTVLVLYGPTGAQLAYNDDIRVGDDLDSRLELTLDPGLYSVVVESFDFGEGDYELSAR